jgi:hypothetical protein
MRHIEERFLDDVLTGLERQPLVRPPPQRRRHSRHEDLVAARYRRESRPCAKAGVWQGQVSRTLPAWAARGVQRSGAADGDLTQGCRAPAGARSCDYGASTKRQRWLGPFQQAP